MSCDLGVIEGRFGRPWTWADRETVMRTLSAVDYRFYHYGPKADRHLRRDWQIAHPAEERVALCKFAARARELGIRFGMALTPVGSTDDFAAHRETLAVRLADLDAIGVDDLVILFDDLRGDIPDLAQRQADVVTFCADRTNASRVFFCPSYYSDDPVLDRVFGPRPDNYLADLGRLLDPAIRIYWTGEEVCSRDISPGHLGRMEHIFRRRVCLWDNYPVNDGVRMSNYLHLRGFSGRPAANAMHLTGHAINPAIQPYLTCVPALTLAASYATGNSYAYGEAMEQAARTLFGDALARALREDLQSFQDVGLDGLEPGRLDDLKGRYAAFDHPAAREVLTWLSGRNRMRAEEVKTQ